MKMRMINRGASPSQEDFAAEFASHSWRRSSSYTHLYHRFKQEAARSTHGLHYRHEDCRCKIWSYALNFQAQRSRKELTCSTFLLIIKPGWWRELDIQSSRVIRWMTEIILRLKIDGAKNITSLSWINQFNSANRGLNSTVTLNTLPVPLKPRG